MQLCISVATKTCEPVTTSSCGMALRVLSRRLARAHPLARAPSAPAARRLSVGDPAAVSFAGAIGAGSRDVPGLVGLPTRREQVAALRRGGNDMFDVLVVGGGAVGSGVALDAQTRGLRTACVERGDFSSETSSRSTKLLWAGIRYIATAAAGLLRAKSLRDPVRAAKDFGGEFMMVLNCHRERRYMMETNPHLCSWQPIALPFSEWFIKPYPFGHPAFGFFPILSPLVFKLYDAMSAFSCPPSYVVGRRRARDMFPQLSRESKGINYIQVFYEAMHNDARTNVAIALTAAEKGAAVANYCEVVDLLKDDGGVVIGAEVLDRVSGDRFDVLAKAVVLCGGPFTDGMRRLERTDPDRPFEPAVRGGSGTHIVLPGYYCPKDMGLLDYNTSDGRFLFFLPWLGHTVVGTTDKQCDAETLPTAPEDEIQWILNECSKYLSLDIRVSRGDVLSAWRGWRPLASDPHADPDGPVSRDHIVSYNDETGVVFCAGGKWTTWREMAQDVVDRVTAERGLRASKCKTRDLGLLGRDGWEITTPVQLVQKYGVAESVAAHLATTYGGRAADVLELAAPTGRNYPRLGIPLADGYPYIEAEVRYACREYAVTVEDVLSRRTRLAFLNSAAATDAIPRVAELMAEELGWSDAERARQLDHAYAYMASYGGPVADKASAALRSATAEDLRRIFDHIDASGDGVLHPTEVRDAAHLLGFPLRDGDEWLDKAFTAMDPDGNGVVTFEEFSAWWNGDSELSGYARRKAALVDEFKLDMAKQLTAPGGKKAAAGNFLG